MKNAAISIILILFIIPLIPTAAWSQGGDGDSFDQTQIITGDRTLTVQKAFKISEMPVVIDVPVKIGDLSYEMIPKRPATKITLEPIEPAKVKVREPLEKIYNGFVKAGAGTFASGYAEAFYTSDRDRDLAYGVHAKHFSANDGINQPVAYSGFSESKINLWGKKVMKKHSLETGLGYALNAYHYYGFDPQDTEIDKKDIRQRFNDFALSANYKSYYRDSSRIHHNIGLDGYYYADRFDADEIGVNVNTRLSSWRGENYYTLDGGLDIISYSSDDLEPFIFINDTTGISIPGESYSNAIFNATPRVLVTRAGFRALVGMGIYAQFDSKARIHVFPDVEVSYSLFNNIFIPYAGITGNVERNSYKTLSRDNPFILSNTTPFYGDRKPLVNSVVKLDVFGGIRGSLSDKLSFNARVGFKNVEDMPLFVNDTLVSAENRFSVIYDQVKTFSILGELSYRNSDKWTATARGQVFNYTTFDEDEAWHLPTYRFTLLGSYNLFDKFLIGSEIALVGKRYAKSLRPVSNLNAESTGYTKVKLDSYLDLSISAEYKFSTRLTAFVELNNLTGSNYDMYYRFPVQRVFLMGGLKFAF